MGWQEGKQEVLHVVWDKVGSRGWDAMAGSRGVPTRDLDGIWELLPKLGLCSLVPNRNSETGTSLVAQW